MKTNSIALLIAFSLTLGSCKKEAQKKTSTIAYQLKTKNSSSSISRMNGTLTWASGYAYVTEIEFEADGDCQVDQQSGLHKQFKAAAPQKVDLFAPLASLGNITLEPCDYKNSKFEIEIHPGPQNIALELKGTYNTTPVIFRIGTALEIDGLNTFTPIAGGVNYTSLTSLNLSLLTKGITAADFSAATLDSTGTMLISANSNTALYQKMLSNFQDIEEEDFH